MKNDRDLWTSFQRGNAASLELLYKRHFRALGRYGFCLTSDSALVEDAIQDVFVDLWQRRDPMDEVDDVKLHLFGALRRQIGRTLRHDYVESIENIDDFLDYLSVLSAEQSPADASLRLSRVRAIQDALAHLDNRQREAVHLRFFQGFGFTEAAETMDISIPTLKNLLSKSYAVLRVTLRAVMSLSVVAGMINLAGVSGQS